MRAKASLAFKNVLFFGTWILGSILWILFDPMVEKMRTQSSSMSRSQYSAQGLEWIGQAWDWMPLWVGLLALIFIMASANAESRRPV
jgi:hypothetical protein